MKILLIAGHGQDDPGAVGNGFKESELAREVTNNLYNILKYYTDVDVFDNSVNMYKFLKSGGAFDFSPYEYILEIHFNAGGGTGTEILVHENQNGVSVEEAILKNISALGFKNRGVKRRSDLLNMNKIFKKGKDYALLEVCFIDNSKDMNIYKSRGYDIALAAANGIISGFQMQLKTNEITTPKDIVDVLSEKIEISDPQKAVDDLTRAMNENSSCYWMLKKISNEIRG